MRAKTFLAIALFTVLASGNAIAWLRAHYSDKEIVSRAQLIVVASVKVNSLAFVPHEVQPGQGLAWEYHATLVIKEVIKGVTRETEMPIVIHYGLRPTVGGRIERQSLTMDFSANRPEDLIEICDTSMAGSAAPFSGDVRKDHLWLLRTEHSRFGDSENAAGIYDPEDVQPLDRLQGLKKYLSN